MSASLERLLKSLANHSDLIASAYSYGHISKDGKNERALNQLHQQKILVKRDEENYRLTAQLSQFLDYALSSERIRRLDTDLGSWMDTLEQSIGLYQIAHHEQRMDDCDNYKFEIEHLVFQLADTLEENTHYLLILVNSRFANVNTLAEKRRQNTFYINRLEKLVHAVSSLTSSTLLETVEDYPDLHQLLAKHLFNILPLYRQRLQDILDTLKNFLFEFRQIEERVKLIRGFAFFLQKNPYYQPQDWSESDTIPTHWNQIKPLSLTAYADIDNSQLEEELKVIVQKLKTETLAALNKTKQRTVSTITSQVNHKILELPLYQKQLNNYFIQVQSSIKPISALKFQQEFVRDIEARLWLSCVLHDYLRRQHRQRLQMELIEVPEEKIFTGNKKVSDIVIWSRPNE